MGVYINMEMPQNCAGCFVGFCKQIGCEHYIGFNDYDRTRHPDCPLIKVPEPHGRVIDADEFDERIRQAVGMCEEELTEDFKDGVQTVLEMLKTQTTIIPSSEEEM